jgi:hypothetical protein
MNVGRYRRVPLDLDSIDLVPRNTHEAYSFLERARCRWLTRVHDTGIDSSCYDTMRILQSAMTSVMTGAPRSIY